MFEQASELWLRRLQRGPERLRRSDRIRLRLFCFPYAGGGASSYRSWMKTLPPTVEVCPVQLPGRESRMGEKPFSRMAPLVNTIAHVLRPFLDLPFAFFGYSFGSLVAFEVAHEIRWRYRLNPSYLFVAAFPAPQLARPDISIHELPQTGFVDGLRRFNAIPEEILQNPELLDLFLPSLRADFAVAETYAFEPEHPLECPISVFGGLHDHNVHRDSLAAWREQTLASFKLRMLPGDHFFIFRNHQRITQAIVEDLGSILNLPGGGSR